MKKVEALIRKSKFKSVKQALVAAGVENFSYWLARNVGETTERRVYRGVEYETSALDRIFLTFYFDEAKLDVIKIITDAGITGEAGDARLAILPVDAVYRVITIGEKDEAQRMDQ